MSVFILGGSKGLGKSLAEQESDVRIFSRTQGVKVDFSKKDTAKIILDHVQDERPKTIYYVAGGGPHGDFFSKPFKSHMWAYEVNYFTPLKIAYGLEELNFKGDFIYIGSAIAERSTSAKSISYAQSKKMARQTFLEIKSFRTLVFSPPYMDTGLLPLKAWPRLECPELVVAPGTVARVLREWVSGEQKWVSIGRHFDWAKEFEYSLPLSRI